MIVIGVDPSTHTGVTVFKDGVMVEGKEVNFPKVTGIDRVARFSDWMVYLLLDWSPDLIVFEGYGYSNAHTLVTLVEIGTVLRLVAKVSDVPYIEIPPTTLKKFATGSGNAKKELVMLEVYKRWGVSFKSNNIADAYVLGMIGACLLNDAGMTKAQAESLSKVVIPKTLVQPTANSV